MKKCLRLLVCALLFVMVYMLPCVMVGNTVAYAAPKKSETVSTQKQLDKALKDKSIKKIVIQTTKKKEFVIEKKTYKGKTLVVNAAKSKVVNAAKWAKISIKDADCYTESAKDNKIEIYDKQLTLVVTKIAKISDLKLMGKTVMDVQGDSVKTMSLEVSSKAKGSVINSTIPLNVENRDKVDIVVNEPNTDDTASKEDSTSDSDSKEDDEEVPNPEETEPDEVKPEETKPEDTKPEDTKPEDVKPEDSKPDETNPETPSESVTPSEPQKEELLTPQQKLQYAIEHAYIGDPVYAVDNISGDVKATWNWKGDLIIDLESYSMNGSLYINAPEATNIYLRDSGVGMSGARISSYLVINAPKAHVECEIMLRGFVIIQDAKDFVVKDEVGKAVSLQGKARLKLDSAVNPVPMVRIDTTKEVVLSGSFDTVSVMISDAVVKMAEDTTIASLEIPENSTGALIDCESEGQLNTRIDTITASERFSLGVSANTINATKGVDYLP